MGKRIYETERLYTREMTEDDLPALRKVLQDEETMWAYDGAFDEKDTRQWLENQLERYRQTGYGLWAVVLKETGEMIGQCGLTRQQIPEGQVLEVGTCFKKRTGTRGMPWKRRGGAKNTPSQC